MLNVFVDVLFVQTWSDTLCKFLAENDVPDVTDPLTAPSRGIQLHNRCFAESETMKPDSSTENPQAMRPCVTVSGIYITRGWRVNGHKVDGAPNVAGIWRRRRFVVHGIV